MLKYDDMIDNNCVLLIYRCSSQFWLNTACYAWHLIMKMVDFDFEIFHLSLWVQRHFSYVVLFNVIFKINVMLTKIMRHFLNVKSSKLFIFPDFWKVGNMPVATCCDLFLLTGIEIVNYE